MVVTYNDFSNSVLAELTQAHQASGCTNELLLETVRGCSPFRLPGLLRLFCLQEAIYEAVDIYEEPYGLADAVDYYKKVFFL